VNIANDSRCVKPDLILRYLTFICQENDIWNHKNDYFGLKATFVKVMKAKQRTEHGTWPLLLILLLITFLNFDTIKNVLFLFLSYIYIYIW